MGKPRGGELLAASVAVVGLLEQWLVGRGPMHVLAPLVCVARLLLGGLLGWRRTWAGAGSTTVLLGVWALLEPEVVSASHAAFPILLVAAGVIGSRTAEDQPTAKVVAPVAWGAACLGSATSFPEDVVFVPLASFGAFLVTRSLTRDRHAASRFREHAQDLAEGRDRVVRDAISHERARIARELHDVISHGISVISLQVGAARFAAPTDPTTALRAVDAAGSAGTQAMVDLRRLTSVLLDEPEDARDPQPRLSDLDQLVLRTRSVGLDVLLNVHGTDRPLPLGIELAVYRLVQEALTNVLKHAGRTRVDVSLGYEPAAVRIEVTNEALGAASAVSCGGHGLIGMRERVELYGGSLSTGLNEGVWYVRARLPTGSP